MVLQIVPVDQPMISASKELLTALILVGQEHANQNVHLIKRTAIVLILQSYSVLIFKGVLLPLQLEQLLVVILLPSLIALLPIHQLVVLLILMEKSFVKILNVLQILAKLMHHTARTILMERQNV